MSEDIRNIAEKYGQTWDVDAPQGIIEEVFSADVVDHNPQPGQTAGIEGVKASSTSIRRPSLTYTSATTTSSFPGIGPP